MSLTAYSASDAVAIPQERTLDPSTQEEWEELRTLGHRMLDDLFDDLA
ncbi:MAG: hypothetical protein JWM54_2261, partial [Acidobacteriaceae bacterium]|nr:hypothetical protein [Acidobacteriaceae bacterium]